MKFLNRLILLSGFLSISAFAQSGPANNLTEKDIAELSHLSTQYMSGMNEAHQSYLCENSKIVEIRVDLNSEYDVQEDEGGVRDGSRAYGTLTFRCAGETEWKPAESCQFFKFKNKPGWEVEYCDT